MNKISKKRYLSRPSRLGLIVLVCSLVTSAVIGVIFILIGDFNETGTRVLATAGTFAGFSVITLPSLFLIERARYRFLTLTGLTASICFFATVIILIWGVDAFDQGLFWKIFGTFGVASFSVNHILLMLIPQPVRLYVRMSQRITVLVIAIVATLILLALWTGEFYGVRVFASLGVLDALGTIAIPILVRISQPRK